MSDGDQGRPLPSPLEPGIEQSTDPNLSVANHEGRINRWQGASLPVNLVYLCHPHRVWNSVTSICSKELRTYKRIGFEYYCEELFVVKCKSKYSCASALYFQLDKQTIKDNCIFDYYYNKTDVKSSILDDGHEIVLANWPSFKRKACSTHNNIPIVIPSHPYVLLNRTILCNCIIEAENNFLLESIAACDPDSVGADL